MKKLVAIKNIDGELYRKVKAVASLEGRTLGSIINEALRLWLSTRAGGGYEEWLRIDEEYKANYEVLQKVYDELLKKHAGKYVVVCGGKILGVFGSYEEAAANAESKCSIEALILRIGAPLKEEVVDLGLPVILK